MLRGFLCAVLFLTAISAAEPLHVYYYEGIAIELISQGGVTVSVSLQDTGNLNQVAVYVDNRSNDAVNVIPSAFVLHQRTPKEVDLAPKSEAEIERIAGHRDLWGHVSQSVGSGVRRAKDRISGADEESGQTPSTDFRAQVQWLAGINELGKKGQAGRLAREYLRGSTVFPKSTYSGVLWFDRDDSFASGTLQVAFGGRTYIFLFPPPSSATSPASPLKAAQTSASDGGSNRPGGQSANHSGSTKPGVLGVTGENWAQGTFGGVKIFEVAENSAAEIAGLRPGYVITEVSGKRISSTEELASELANHAPGTRVQIVYLVRTNLGWMPQRTFAILALGD